VTHAERSWRRTGHFPAALAATPPGASAAARGNARTVFTGDNLEHCPEVALIGRSHTIHMVNCGIKRAFKRLFTARGKSGLSKGLSVPGPGKELTIHQNPRTLKPSAVEDYGRLNTKEK
jgi:hypothetical protein